MGMLALRIRFTIAEVAELLPDGAELLPDGAELLPNGIVELTSNDP